MATVEVAGLPEVALKHLATFCPTTSHGVPVVSRLKFHKLEPKNSTQRNIKKDKVNSPLITEDVADNDNHTNWISSFLSGECNRPEAGEETN